MCGISPLIPVACGISRNTILESGWIFYRRFLEIQSFPLLFGIQEEKGESIVALAPSPFPSILPSSSCLGGEDSEACVGGPVELRTTTPRQMMQYKLTGG